MGVARGGRGNRGKPNKQVPGFVLITDPGPDPDDVKALLVLGILHKGGTISLDAVVANGGQQPARRARLAKCILEHVGEREVPVGIGSQGKEYKAQPHEYSIQGYDNVKEEDLEQGPSLLLRKLRDAPPKSVTFICISSLRDLADLMLKEENLVKDKVRLVAIQGGLEKRGPESIPESPVEAVTPTGSSTNYSPQWGTRRSRKSMQISPWVPDSSVNNGFDMEAAEIVYSFCLEQGIPMTVTSRNAVPTIPMQLARSFAARTECPVMSYLADAQFMGLEGLWMKICAGLLPARCNKEWYFNTFCGVQPARFQAEGLDQLDESADIKSRLKGFVKPYDVIALMTALPHTAHRFPRLEAAYSFRGVSHMLFLEQNHQVDVRYVIELLRDTYHEVVAATTAPDVPAPWSSARSADRKAKGAGARMNSINGYLRRALGLASVKSNKTNTYSSASRTPSAGHLDREGSVEGGSSTSGVGGRVPNNQLRTALDTSNSTSFASRHSSRHSDLARRRHADKSPSLQSAAIKRVPGEPIMPGEIGRILQGALEEAAFQQMLITTNMRVASAVLFVGAIIAIVVDAEVARLNANGVPLAAMLPLQIRLSAYNVPLLAAFPLAMLSLHNTEAQRHQIIGACLTLALLAVISGIANAAAVGPEASEYYSEAELVFFGLQTALSPILGFWQARVTWELRDGLLWRLLQHLWRSTGVILAAYFGCSLGFWCAAAATSTFYADPGMTSGVGMGERAVLFAVDLTHAGVGAVLGACMAHPAFSRRIQAFLVTSIGDAGELAPLAPLIGFGTQRIQEPRTLVDDAKKCFKGMQLDDECLAALRGGFSNSLPTVTSLPTAPGQSQTWSRTGSVDKTTTVHPEDSNHAAVPNVAMMLLPHMVKEACRPVKRTLPTPTTFPPRFEGSLPPWDEEAIDYYVVHSKRDPPEAKNAALAEWSKAYGEKNGGKLPVVWIDALCANPSLTLEQRMQHMPVYLALSRKLLVLSGPTLVDSLWCVVELYCWSILGGSPEDIEVIVLGGEDPQANIAAFDAFHVMWVPQDNTACTAQLTRVVEMATVSGFNQAIRGYLKHVRADLDRKHIGS